MRIPSLLLAASASIESLAAVGGSQQAAENVLDAGGSPSLIAREVMNTPPGAHTPGEPTMVISAAQMQQMIADAIKQATGASTLQLREAEARVKRAELEAAAAKFYSHKIGGMGNPRPSEADVEILTENGRTIVMVPMYVNLVPKHGNYYLVGAYENNEPILEGRRPVKCLRRDLISAETIINDSVQGIPVGLSGEESPFRVMATLKVHTRYERQPLPDSLKKLVESQFKNEIVRFIDVPVSTTTSEVDEKHDKREARTNLSERGDNGEPGAPESKEATREEQEAAIEYAISKNITEDAALAYIISQRV